MSKRSIRRKNMPKTSKPSQANMMAQMQTMQQQMAQAQEALADETVTVTTGGGMITVVMTGHQRMQSLTIDPEVLDPDDVELLQDMLLSAVNAAIEQSQALSAERMEGITGGIDLGGLDSLLGGF
ncbi:MAG: YbaB/EbfC family nucleoid-associated protein [Chloroflexi bacterium]|nr:YbaB/EbfC family nucleoid-associated protein [Chloroflexota bacterium]